MSTEKPVQFTLSLRIPAWCDEATIAINGHRHDRVSKAVTFAELDRTFQDGDRIELCSPMPLKLTRWGKGDRGSAIERGPLVYSLPVEAKQRSYLYVTGEDASDFPSYFLYPTGEWNYALELNEQNLEASGDVLEDEAVADGYGWDLAATPVRLQVPARTVTNWTLDPARSTPVWPDRLELSDRSETVTLVLSDTFLIGGA